MMPLFELMMEKAPTTFPPIKGKTGDGLNFNLLEDIVVGIQTRLFLYLECEETGISYSFKNCFQLRYIYTLHATIETIDIQTEYAYSL